MAAPTRMIKIAADNAFRIKKIKVKKGQDISKGTLLCLFTTGSSVAQKFKSCHGGTINNIHVKEGEDVSKGDVMFTLEGCTHPTVMKDMCASCGVDLRLENSTAGNRKEDVTASVAMVHSIPELIVSEQMAKELGKADQDKLLSNRKLVLLVDLDQTIIHTTVDNVPANLKGVKHFQLWHGNQLLWHHTKLRPGTVKFLEEISKLFELHICTFGSRMYAHTIAKLLDPEGKFFSYRILSRDECFDASLKTANLKALFPCGDSMVCIIDDREDVWNFVPNMVHVKPYRFFEGTADINAPPGLPKTAETNKDESKGLSSEYRENIEPPDKKENVNEEQNQVEIKVEHVNELNQGKESDKHPVGKTVEDQGTMKLESCHTDKNKEAVSNENSENTEKTVDMTTEDSKPVSIELPEPLSVEPSDPVSVGPSDQVLVDVHMPVDSSRSVEQKTIHISGNKVINLDDNDCESSKKVISDSIESNKDDSEKISQKEDKDMDALDTSQSVNKDSTAEDESLNKKHYVSNKGKEKVEGKGNIESKKAETDNDKEERDKDNEEIEWEDEDDYLFYLEDILKNIHTAFYDMYDQMQQKNTDDINTNPSLKDIIPYIKKKVLKGCNIVFSGIIPTNMQFEKNRAYIMAVSLGANVQQEIKHKSNEKDPKNYTTHLISSRMGTTKVRTAVKFKHIRIVNLKWLWCCYERWERVEESLYLDIPNTKLSDDGRDSPEPSKLAGTKRKMDNDQDRSMNKKVKSEDESKQDLNNETESIDTNRAEKAADDNATEAEKSDNFSMTYNPLYAFSDDDIAYMDKEVEDEIEDEEDESSEEEEARNERVRKQVLAFRRLEEETSSEDSMTGDMPRGWGLKGKMSPKWSSSDEDEKKSSPRELGPEYESETDQDKFEKIMEAFGPVTSSDEEYQESIGSVDEEMADAIMKEFLS